MTDLTIQCGKRDFNVHAVLLTAQSSYFATLFKMKPVRWSSESKYFYKIDDQEEVISAVIEFLYRRNYSDFSSDVDFPRATALQHIKVWNLVSTRPG
jgi:hypothetical protein